MICDNNNGLKRGKKMIGQYYTVNSEDGKDAVLGAFIYESNSDDKLIGFVYDSYDGIVEIVLFEPMELPNNVIECKEMPSKYSDMLVDVIKNRASEEVKDMWARACFFED